MTAPVNVVCMKWGTAYGSDYVNRLRAMVGRHLARPFRFMCFTDDTTGIDAAVETAPLPPIELDAVHGVLPWRKLSLFNREIADLSGPTLFLDLDLVVVDSLEPFFDYEPDRFCIIHNWTHPDRRIGNSSVYRFEVGRHVDLLDRFHGQPIAHWVAEFRNEQRYLSHYLADMAFWPASWCVSFKRHCLPAWPLRLVAPAPLPAGAHIVVFHGRPNPSDVLAGRWPEPKWWKRPIKQVRRPDWLADHWR